MDASDQWMNAYFVSAGEVTEYDYYQVEPPDTYVLVESGAIQ